MDIIFQGIMIAGLMVNAIIDIKKKEVSVPVIGIMMLAGIVWWGLDYKDFEITRLQAFIPGIAVLCLAVISRQKSVGLGDGAIILAMGFFCTLEKLLLLCMCSISLAGVVGVVLLLIFRKSRYYEMPFVPFLAIGYGIVRCFG